MADLPLTPSNIFKRCNQDQIVAELTGRGIAVPQNEWLARVMLHDAVHPGNAVLGSAPVATTAAPVAPDHATRSTHGTLPAAGVNIRPALPCLSAKPPDASVPVLQAPSAPAHATMAIHGTLPAAGVDSAPAFPSAPSFPLPPAPADSRAVGPSTSVPGFSVSHAEAVAAGQHE